MKNYPQIELSLKALEDLQASTKAIEALGIRIGEIGADSLKKTIASVNEAAAKIKPVEFDFSREDKNNA